MWLLQYSFCGTQKELSCTFLFVPAMITSSLLLLQDTYLQQQAKIVIFSISIIYLLYYSSSGASTTSPSFMAKFPLVTQSCV